MAKTVLLQQTTFTGSATGSVYAFAVDNLLINAESITVVYDGVKYENLPVRKRTAAGREFFYYGAEMNPFDFSTYPFVIVSGKEGGDE